MKKLKKEIEEGIIRLEKQFDARDWKFDVEKTNWVDSKTGDEFKYKDGNLRTVIIKLNNVLRDINTHLDEK